MHPSIPVLRSRWLLVLSLPLILYGLAVLVAPGLMNNTLVGSLLYHTSGLSSVFAKLAEP
jgi:hypothetical protein